MDPTATLARPEDSAETRPRPIAIDVSHVSQTFASSDGQSVTALQDVSLTVRHHEFVSIIGPSGCGKSTLLRLLTSLLKPTSGSISIFGLELTEPRDDVGFVFQRPTLLPWLNVLENIVFPVRHKTGAVSAADRKRAQDLLAIIGLPDIGNKRPNELSGGMQQRVAIARSLLQDPDILLMDEPFSALDAMTRDEMSFELLRILARAPKTVVFVTHSIAEALLMSDRIFVLRARPGRLEEIVDVPLTRPRGLHTMAEPLFGEMSTAIRERIYARGKA